MINPTSAMKSASSTHSTLLCLDVDGTTITI
jgi:hypothetical protein